MKKILLSLTCLLLAELISNAQTGLQIYGKVIDKESNAISYAKVKLKNTKDDATITTTLTKEDGGFFINQIVDQGSYLEISYLGKKLYRSSTFGTRNGPQNITLPPIELKQDIYINQDIRIKSNTELIKVMDHKIIIDVSSLIFNNTNLMTVIPLLPGIIIDNNRTIKSEVVDSLQILINNKKLKNQDLQIIHQFEQILLQSVKSIEIYYQTDQTSNTNPSSLNIIMHPTKKKLWNCKK